MATVTMTGKEYEEMLVKMHTLEIRVQEVTQWLKDSAHLEIPDDSYTRWCAGRLVGLAPLPKWMADVMYAEVARQLMCQEVPVLKKLEENGTHYYDPFDTSLRNYGGEDVIPYFPGLDKVWEDAHLDNEADKAALEDGVQEVEEDECNV